MAIWHPDCYEAKFGTRPIPLSTKFDNSQCGAQTCIHKLGRKIGYEQPYVWIKNGELMNKIEGSSNQVTKAADAFYKKPETSSLSASEAEKLIGKLIEAAVKRNLPNQEMQNANLRSIVEQELKRTFDPEKTTEKIISTVEAFLAAELKKQQAIQVEIKAPSGEIKSVGTQHKQFPVLLKAVMARVNVWLAGPSGSGKTTAAQNVAAALELPYRYTGAVGDPYALIGYNDANGKYVRTPFREAYEHGGLFLWDEIDASDPNALLAFNAALANSNCPFPDAIINKHKDCVMVAAANTWGHGASHEYVGRLKMDAAFLKRFAFIAWNYDDAMEMSTAPNPEWTKRVQAVRQKIKEKGLRVLCTPRESYLGAQLLAVGLDWDTVEEMTIKSGMSEDQWKQIGAKPAFTKASTFDEYKDQFGGKTKKKNISIPEWDSANQKYSDAYDNYFTSYSDAELNGRF